MSPEKYPYNRGTWHDERSLTDTPDRGEWRCPFCDNAMPNGNDHETWVCCGEMGRAEHWHFDSRWQFGKVRGWVRTDDDAY